MKLNVINSSSGQNNTIFAATGGRVLDPELPDLTPKSTIDPAPLGRIREASS